MCEGMSDAFERIKNNTDGKREHALHAVAVQAVGFRAAERVIVSRFLSVCLMEKHPFLWRKTYKQQAFEEF